MTEGEPQPGKSREQQKADRLDKLYNGLSNFLHSNIDRVDQAELDRVENSWADAVDEVHQGLIKPELALIKLSGIFEEMKSLTIASGISPEEITEEKLESYDK